MAKKIITTVTDDLDGADGASAIEFALDGQAYEIDLAPGNADAFRAAMGRYTDAARRISRGKPKARRTAVSRAANGEIREWARQNGYQVSERGRIPADAEAAYYAAAARG